MTRQKIVFKNKAGLELSASLELPANEVVAYALFAHCFTCSKDALAAFRISQALTDSGIAVLRFDFTGLGNSQGDFANTNFSSNVEDLLSAADYLRTQHKAPSLLIGHSFGGSAVLVAATHLPETKAIVTIAAPAHLTQLKVLFTDKLDEISTEGEAEVDLAGRKFHIKKQFLDNLEQSDLLSITASLDKALLIFHSFQDTLVPIQHAYDIFNAATHAKNIITLEGADHLLSAKKDAMYVATLIADWSSRYLPVVNAATDLKIDRQSAQVIVHGTQQGKFKQEVIMGEHTLIADEPVSAGGDNAGPNPYDLLLAGLGACTSMTIRLYADFKKIPLEDVIVKLNHGKEYAADCEHCEDEKAKVDHIERLIELKGNLSEEQKAKLLAIANKCPVHKTLTSTITITTQLV